MDKLATVTKSLTATNKALREAIEIRADEVGRLEHFEEGFRTAKDKFLQYKEAAIKYNRQTEEIQAILNQELGRHRRTAEDLRRQIADFRRKIEEQRLENEKLERDLKDNVEGLRKLKNTSNYNNSYVNSQRINSSPFIERLRN